MQLETHEHDLHSDGVRRAAELAAAVAAAVEALIRLQARRAAEQAERNAGAARLHRAAIQAEHAAARARWAPALDGSWLREAGTLDVARTWGAALPWGGEDQEALLAIDRSEARLRELHPNAMGEYDNLRAGGLDRVEAMQRVAYLMDRPAPVERDTMEVMGVDPPPAERDERGRFGPGVVPVGELSAGDAFGTGSAGSPPGSGDLVVDLDGGPGRGRDLASQTLANRERQVAAVENNIPDVAATDVDEHIEGEFDAQKHAGLARSYQAAADHPAAVASMAFPKPVHEALTRPGPAPKTRPAPAPVPTPTASRGR